MDEIIKELREDKNRAWEMISFLNERLSKAEKQGSYEELHIKMDKLLGKQTDLEKEVKYMKEEFEKSQGYIACFVESHEELKEATKTLKENTNNVVDGVSNSNEMKKVIDTVETVEGYIELFVKDFDKIHAKMDEIEVKLGNAFQLEHTMNLIVDEVSKVQDKIKGNEELVSKLYHEVQKGNEKMEKVLDPKQQLQEIETTLKSQRRTIETLKKDIAEKFKAPTVTYKCLNSNCHAILTKDLVLKEDGVSVQCPNIDCKEENIVETLKEGQKWMLMYCNGDIHNQQFPLYQKHGEWAMCRLCGSERIVLDTCKIANITLED